MKTVKIMIPLVLWGIFNVAYADNTYACDRYVNGQYKGYVKVVANNKTEAEQKALIKYRQKLKLRADYVKCKMALLP